MWRAPVAGNSERMSSVALNTMLIRSSVRTPLRSKRTSSRPPTRSVICSGVSSSMVVAPRRARTTAGIPQNLVARPRPPQPARDVRGALARGHPTAPAVRRPRPARGPGPRRWRGRASSRSERPVGQRAEADPHQAPDRVADGLAHAADLAVAALVDHEADHVRLHQRRPRRGGRAVVEHHALAQPAEHAPRRATARPTPGTPSPRRTTDGSAGGRGRRRWSAAGGPRCRGRAGPPGTPAARPGTSSTTEGRPWGSSAEVTTPAGLLSR